jgi:hypothetical protein
MTYIHKKKNKKNNEIAAALKYIKKYIKVYKYLTEILISKGFFF